MTNIFSEIDLEAEAANVKQTSDYSQDLAPDEPTAPVTAQEREALDRRMDEGRSDIFTDVDTFGDRAPLDYGRGEWILPKVRQARRRAALLPRSGMIKQQEDRLFEVARHEGQPDELRDAVTLARKACQKAYGVLDKARHPEAPSKAKNPAAKQACLDAIDAAKAAVDDVVRISQRDDVRAQQYETVVSGIAEAQEKAAEALEVAAATDVARCAHHLDHAEGQRAAALLRVVRLGQVVSLQGRSRCAVRAPGRQPSSPLAQPSPRRVVAPLLRHASRA